MPTLAPEIPIPDSSPQVLLDVQSVSAGYGKIGVLHGVSITVHAGEVVSLLGPNGAGKTTLLRAISGLLPLTGGSLRFDARDLTGSGPRETARTGLVHVIEGHRVFTQQTIADNMLLAGYDVPRRERARRIEQALAYFPEIASRLQVLGGALSGGQQQMLAVAQGLVRQPKLLMLDEPSAGLAPVLVDRVLDVIGELKRQGTAVLLVEQLVEKAISRSDRVYAIARGRIVLEAAATTPDLPRRLEHAYFGHTDAAIPPAV